MTGHTAGAKAGRTGTGGRCARLCGKPGAVAGPQHAPGRRAGQGRAGQPAWGFRGQPPTSVAGGGRRRTALLLLSQLPPELLPEEPLPRGYPAGPGAGEGPKLTECGSKPSIFLRGTQFPLCLLH